MKKRKKILFWIVLALSIAIDIFIIVNACINGEASAHESNSIAHATADVINIVKPDTITPSNFDSFAFSFRKIAGHFALFLTSGIFTTLSVSIGSKETKFDNLFYLSLFTLGHGIILAGFSEFLQIFVSARTGSLKDVVIDLGGYFIGVFLVILIISLVNLRKKRKQN